MLIQSILDVKGSEVATIASDATLADAVASLRDHGIGALVVSDDGEHVVGILSERDVVRAVAAHGMSSLGRTVASAMSAKVQTCSAEDTTVELMRVMTDGRFRHVPVLDGESKLAGIISIGDVVKHRVEELVGENQTLVDYIGAR